MELLGALSHQQIQERLRHLSGKLDELASSRAKPRRSGRIDRRIRPGVVLDAVVSVLSSADRPMQAREIHEAVLALVGRPVPYSSVKARLADKAQGAEAPFERLARGCYRLSPVTQPGPSS